MLKQRSTGINLVVIDGMWHSGIPAKFDGCAHMAQNNFRLLDALEGNMRIGIAGAKEHRRAVERAGIVPRRPRRPDEAAGQPDCRAVTTRMSGDKLQRKARTL